MRMTVLACVCAFVGANANVRAQESIKVETGRQAPPSGLSAAVKQTLDGPSYKILDEKGQALGTIWLRKAVPGSERPSGPKGPVQFPFLADGELLGAIEFAAEGHDYRDQPIARGTYTMRFALQPVNGDHLGVSTYRDYVLLLPAAKDVAPPPPKRKELEEQSAEAADSTHPASFLLLSVPAGTKPIPGALHDAEKNTWSVVLPLQLQIKGQEQPLAFPVQLIVVGAAAV